MAGWPVETFPLGTILTDNCTVNNIISLYYTVKGLKYVRCIKEAIIIDRQKSAVLLSNRPGIVTSEIGCTRLCYDPSSDSISQNERTELM